MTDYDRVCQAHKLYLNEVRSHLLRKLKAHHGPGKDRRLAMLDPTPLVTGLYRALARGSQG